MFERLVQEFERLPKNETEENIFSICGFPHYERVCSNLLEFFFDSKREHRLNDLFLVALFSFIKKVDFAHDEYFQIETEFQTKKGNFIDLLLRSESCCVVLENKIRAWVYNDLDDYLETASTLAPTFFGIVLSLTKQKLPNANWTYITYEELFNSIRERLGNFILGSNPRYLSLLIEFMENLGQLSGGAVVDDNFLDFLATNEGAVQNIIQKTEEVRSGLRKKVQAVGDLISEQVNDTNLKQWVWRTGRELYDVAVSDFRIDGRVVTVHSELFLDGWHFSVWSRDEGFSVREIVETCGNIGLKGSLENSRFELEQRFEFHEVEQNVAGFSANLLICFKEKCFTKFSP